MCEEFMFCPEPRIQLLGLIYLQRKQFQQTLKCFCSINNKLSQVLLKIVLWIFLWVFSESKKKSRNEKNK